MRARRSWIRCSNSSRSDLRDAKARSKVIRINLFTLRPVSAATTLRRAWSSLGTSLTVIFTMAPLWHRNEFFKDLRCSGTHCLAQTSGGGQLHEGIGVGAEEVPGVKDWTPLKKGDWRKGLVAGPIRRRFPVDHEGRAREQEIGVRNTASRVIRLVWERA